MAQTPADAQQPIYPPVAPAEDGSKAALGYAYLWMLATEASFGCSLVAQHADAYGVDVRLHIREQLDPQAQLNDFSLDFQLRATCRGLPVVDRKLLFSLEVERYEALRSAVAERPRFIVLLSLPTDYAPGDELSAEDLIAQRRGRWLCLSGAPQTSNTTAVPVRFPAWNVLTPASLREMARRVSLGLRFFHEQ